MRSLQKHCYLNQRISDPGMLRQCGERAGRYARVAAPRCAQQALGGRSTLTHAQLSAPLPLRYAATMAKLTNTMQPEEIRFDT
jgi:hypothetical protein